MIEMAIVLFASGIILMGIVSIYKQYQAAVYYKTTQANIAAVNQAIATYVNNNPNNPYHLLPCPADPKKPMGDPNFGHALALNGLTPILDPKTGLPTGKFYPDYPCPAVDAANNTLVAAYGGLAAVSKVAKPMGGSVRIQAVTIPSLRSSTYYPGGVASLPNTVNTTGAPWQSFGYIRVGAVPIYDLGLGSQYIADASGNLFIYAVSEELANLPPQPVQFSTTSNGTADAAPSSFSFATTPTYSATINAAMGNPGNLNPYTNTSVNMTHGMIEVQDGAGHSLTNNYSGAYAIISPGRAGVGAYTLNGTLHSACGAPGSAFDMNNCKVYGVGWSWSGYFISAPYGQ